jgi:glutathione S-transferase
MKIIETRSAPNPRRVRIFLAEKGLAEKGLAEKGPAEKVVSIAFEELDLNQLKTEQFTKLNPFQRVPVLVFDDGTTLSETVAICRYFEELYPTPALFGSGARGRATVEMWQRRMELELLLPVAMVFRHLHPAMVHLEVPQVKEWGEANKPRALDVLHVLDRELATRPFIAGAEFSIADITALCAIDFMRPSRLKRPDGLQHLERWYGDMSARPSAKA